MIKSFVILLCSAGVTNHPFIQHIHRVYATHSLNSLMAISVIKQTLSQYCTACIQVMVTLISNGFPRHQSSDASSWTMPTRSCQVALVSEEVKVVSYRENGVLSLLRSVVRMNLLFVKLWERKTHFMFVLLPHLKLPMLWLRCDDCLVAMEKIIEFVGGRHEWKMCFNCYNCFPLPLANVVDFLRCLLWKLNFIIGTYA